MSERTILCKIQADRSLKLSPKDADFLGLAPGKTLVLQVREPFSGSNSARSFHATVSVAENEDRAPRAFR
jgi:hypothetical protein